ncbi:M48 family metallopeptidase [Pseudogulbenkiania ferrooxidans]|uniref:Ste24 endopeptidase n=1 Tax=Pseudogulbenkiania ferrooxidans 2002 TaxID=279714 RepID=B9YZP8_9NEIS|nr:M48 family metallopeptidase [Pseudogulbenkiania ferrooxidans]EEG09781.1 Ste24 endopeptidase [Pseudogulbenkiania ferrooxidans 2002]
MTNAFTYAFLLALGGSLLLRLWLARRHTRHILRHRQQLPAGFADSIPLEAHQRAADYTVAKTRLGMLNAAADTLLILALTLGGGLQGLWQLSANLAGSDLLRGLILIGAVSLVSGAVSLPFSLARTFGVEARFGFNSTTPKLFFLDLIKSTTLGIMIGAPLLLLVLWLMSIMGSLWWLWVWLLWSVFSVLLVAVYPTLIAPLFNKFQPLQDATLSQRIDALLQRCGFKSQGIFVMDGSTRSSHGNAYFTGFGASKRIVFFDTLLKRLEHDEIEAVLAHELGHFHKRHVIKRIGLTFALSLGFLFILGRLIDASWFYQGLGLTSQSNALALVLFFMVIPAFTFPLTPLSSLLSRRHEYEADDFAAAQVSAEALASALVKLYRDNASTLTPDPLHSAFYDSHPPATLRIAHLKGEHA